MNLCERSYCPAGDPPKSKAPSAFRDPSFAGRSACQSRRADHGRSPQRPSAPNLESLSFQSIEPEVGIGSLIFDWPALYSIRVPPIGREIVCRGCKSRFYATGSTGFADERPICDRCLYAGCRELGMLMALAAAARAYSKLAASEDVERDQGLEQLIEIALSFDDIASRSGPARPIPALEREREAGPSEY